MYKKLFGGMLVLISVVILTTGCGERTKNNPSNGINQIPGDQDVVTEESLKWPKDVMENIPSFKGVISKSWYEDNRGSMVFVDTKRDETDRYIQTLTDSGFRKKLDIDDQEIYLYAASREENKELITVTFIEKESRLLISYLKQ